MNARLWISTLCLLSGCTAIPQLSKVPVTDRAWPSTAVLDRITSAHEIKYGADLEGAEETYPGVVVEVLGLSEDRQTLLPYRGPRVATQVIRNALVERLKEGPPPLNDWQFREGEWPTTLDAMARDLVARLTQQERSAAIEFEDLWEFEEAVFRHEFVADRYGFARGHPLSSTSFAEDVFERAVQMLRWSDCPPAAATSLLSLAEKRPHDHRTIVTTVDDAVQLLLLRLPDYAADPETWQDGSTDATIRNLCGLWHSNDMLERRALSLEAVVDHYSEASIEHAEIRPGVDDDPEEEIDWLSRDEWPKTLEEAAQRLANELRADGVKAEEFDPGGEHFGLGAYVRNRFGIWRRNDALHLDVLKGVEGHPDDVSGPIMIRAKEILLSTERAATR